MVLKHLKGKSPYITDLIDYMKEPSSRTHCLIFERFGDHSLRQFIKEIYTPNDVKNIVRMLLEALKTTHENGIIHRDVKPDNIIYDTEDKKIKLIDWGLAEFALPEHSYNLRVSTRPFKCPEILINYRKYDYSFDLWGAGSILACLVSLEAVKKESCVFRQGS